jgi:hypothetical protein
LRVTKSNLNVIEYFIYLLYYSVLLGIFSGWQESDNSALPASVTSISGTDGNEASSFLVYTQVHRLFVPSPSAAHTRGGAANFAVITFAKRELALSSLRKAKPVKTALSNMRFVQITYLEDNLKTI